MYEPTKKKNKNPQSLRAPSRIHRSCPRTDSLFFQRFFFLFFFHTNKSSLVCAYVCIDCYCYQLLLLLLYKPWHTTRSVRSRVLTLYLINFLRALFIFLFQMNKNNKFKKKICVEKRV